MTVLFPEVFDVRADRLEDPQSEEAEQAYEAKSNGFVDALAAVSIASNYRCVSPSVGDSGGTLGRRT